jgi:ferredoxin
MQLEKDNIELFECTGCGACELACSFYRDKVFTTIRSSVMMYREEKKNYFGVVVKIKDDLILGKPEGTELNSEGASKEEKPSAKPILMREECDLCGGDPLCVKFCPVGVIKR